MPISPLVRQKWAAGWSVPWGSSSSSLEVAQAKLSAVHRQRWEGFHFTSQNLFSEPQLVLAKFSGHIKAKRPVFEKLYTAEKERPGRDVVLLMKLSVLMAPYSWNGEGRGENETTRVPWAKWCPWMDKHFHRWWTLYNLSIPHLFSRLPISRSTSCSVGNFEGQCRERVRIPRMNKVNSLPFKVGNE